MSSTEPSRLSLNYAPPLPWHRRKRYRRLILLVIIGGIALPVLYWRRPIMDKARFLYWQHQCLTYTAPPDLVVYEEDAAAAAQLLSRPGYFPITGFQPSSSPPIAAYIPRCHGPLSLPIGAPPQCAIVFIHELRSSGGHRRLVIIQKRPLFGQPLYAPFELEAVVLKPASWTTGLEYMPPTSNRMRPIDIAMMPLPWVNSRFFAGQPDPADASHFTIRYEMDATPSGRRASGIIDGRLNADGSHVSMKVRDPALSTPWATPVLPDPD